MPKFTFNGVELQYNLFTGGSNNFDGKYTPLSRDTISRSNDRLDGGAYDNGSNPGSGFSLYGIDISETTTGKTYILIPNNGKVTDTAPTWAKGITVQGHGGGGGGGGGGGRSWAKWAGDAESYGGTGGSGGYGGYGYIRRNVNGGQNIIFQAGAGGGGGNAGANETSPNNNAHGGAGGAGGAGHESYVNIANVKLSCGLGGGGGSGGGRPAHVNDTQAGIKTGGGDGAPGHDATGANIYWNNTYLQYSHNKVNGGTNMKGGSNGNGGVIIYRWNTATVTEYHTT
jgi:hypothetical protein